MVMMHKTKEKFQPKWEGSFVVQTVHLNGAYQLITQHGDRMMMSINKKFMTIIKGMKSPDLIFNMTNQEILAHG